MSYQLLVRPECVIHSHEQWRFDRADRLRKELTEEYKVRALKESCNFDCDIYVHPAWRGSCRVGFRYSGRYRITFSWQDSNSIKHPTTKQKVIYATEKEKDRIWMWYKKHVHDQVLGVQIWLHILSMYRESGLIPKHIARKHNKEITEKYGKGVRHNKIAMLALYLKMRRYLERYPKCKCGGKGFSETIIGWRCNSCCRTWDLTEPRKAKWIEV